MVLGRSAISMPSRHACCLCGAWTRRHHGCGPCSQAVLLVSNVAPMLVPFRSPEAFLAKWLHDLTGTEVPFKILEAVQPRPIAKPKKA